MPTALDPSTAADITYAYWDSSQKPALDAIIAAFNKNYPNIRVTSEITPWAQYWTKLQTEGQSKTLPDVFWMNGPNFQLYASNGLLLPLDTTSVDVSNYPSALNQLYTYNGTQYGLPKDYDTVAVYYNKAVFDAAGVSYPTAGWTWDDFHQKAKAISDKLKSSGTYGIVGGLVGGATMYYPTIELWGGYVISPDKKKSGYDDPNTIKGLQSIRDLIADGSSPTLAQLSDTPPDQWFGSGKAGMLMSGSWSNAALLKSDVKNSIGLVELPVGTKQATSIHGLSNVVAKDSKNVAAATAFQKFLGSKQANTIQAQMGAANPAYNGTAQAFIDSSPWDVSIFIKSAAFAVPFPASKNTAVWNKYEDALLPDAFNGTLPVADVAKKLVSEMNAALAKD